jgi:hypothetical protein
LKNSFINEYRKKSKQPAKVDYQEVETYYNSESVDYSITSDLRVDAVKDMIGDEIQCPEQPGSGFQNGDHIM